MAEPLAAATDMADVVADGVTLGFGNKLTAALATLTSDESYGELLAKNRALTQSAYNRAGLPGDVLGLVGGIRSGKTLVDKSLGFTRWTPKAVPGAPRPDLLKRLGNFGRTSALAAADGAVLGAVDAIGHDSDVGTGIATGAGVGFLTPGAVNALGAAFSPIWTRVSSSPAAQRIIADLQTDSGARRRVETSASRKVGHDAPDVPQRPFEADYPTTPEYDEKTGGLLVDIEGRPLRAELIAGRRAIGGGDVALTPEEVRAAGSGLRVVYRKVDRREIANNPGRIKIRYNPDTGAYEKATVRIDKKLRTDARARVEAHETGHVLDGIVKGISIDGIEDELRLVYSTLRHGPDRTTLRGPEHDGYGGPQIREELIAEALRAYIRHPNWFKTVAPNAAKSLRARINPDPKINPYLQLNSLVGAVGAGIGAGALIDEGEDAAPRPSLPKEL